MSFLQALILGVLQGITEFLPISSSGHLVLLQDLLGLTDPIALKAFDIAVHFGTLLAILIYFRRDFWELIKAFLLWIGPKKFRRDIDSGWFSGQKRLLTVLLTGTVPALIIGFFWGDLLDEYFLAPLPVCVMLFGVSFLFLLAEYVYKKSAQRRTTVSMRDGIIIGLAQAAALIPGVSRSGATISGGLFLGIERSRAARFSFLLGSIAMLAATALAVLKVVKHEYSLPAADILVTGIVSSFAAGWLAISFLMNYLKKHTLAVFAWYRMVAVLAFSLWFFWISKL
jgi:undecaprenyl-diphosphatase